MRSQKLSQPSSVLIFCFSTIPRLLSRLSSYQAGLRILGTEMVFCCVHRLVLDLPISTHSGLGYTIFDSVLVSIINSLSIYIFSVRACHYNGILIYFSVLSSVHFQEFLRCNVRTAFVALQLPFSSASRFGRISWIFTKRKRLRLAIDRKFRCYLIRCPKFFFFPHGILRFMKQFRALPITWTVDIHSASLNLHLFLQKLINHSIARDIKWTWVIKKQLITCLCSTIN